MQAVWRAKNMKDIANQATKYAAEQLEAMRTTFASVLVGTVTTLVFFSVVMVATYDERTPQWTLRKALLFGVLGVCGFSWSKALREYFGSANHRFGLGYCFWFDVFTDGYTLFYAVYVAASALGLFYNEAFYSFHLLDLVVQSPELMNVMKSVTIPRRQLGLTLVLASFLIYIFAVAVFFGAPEQMTNSESYNNECQTLIGCFIAFMHHGLLAGGGIGDYISNELGHSLPSWRHGNLDSFAFRICIDLLFFIVILVLLMNIIFGITIDQFGALRDEANSNKMYREEFCFICNNSKERFNSHYMQRGLTRGFEKHIKDDHNMWNYMYYM